jgi:hypothetical protein
MVATGHCARSRTGINIDDASVYCHGSDRRLCDSPHCSRHAAGDVEMSGTRPSLFDPVIPTTPPGETTTYLDEEGRRVTRLPPGIADGVVPGLTALPAKVATDVE